MKIYVRHAIQGTEKFSVKIFIKIDASKLFAKFSYLTGAN